MRNAFYVFINSKAHNQNHHEYQHDKNVYSSRKASAGSILLAFTTGISVPTNEIKSNIK